MNNDQDRLIEEAYQNYSLELVSGGHSLLTYEGSKLPKTKEEFINKCKTDREFSKTWGLSIEERNLTEPERYDLWISKNYETGIEYNPANKPDYSNPYWNKTPTKLTTVIYRGTHAVVYE